MPDNTSDLVALTQFLENASSVTVVNLQTAVDEAGERLLFLLEYATLPCMLAFFTHLIFPNLLVEFTRESLLQPRSQGSQEREPGNEVEVCCSSVVEHLFLQPVCVCLTPVGRTPSFIATVACVT